MSKSNNDNQKCFELFWDDPREFSEERLQGAHKYLVAAINGDHEGPTVDVLIDIFNVFSKETIKRYVFKTMKKSMNLELAVSIIQDLLANGNERAKSLELHVEKLASKGRKVVISDKFATPGEKPISEDDFLSAFGEIDEAIVRLSVKSGKSPDRAISLTQGSGPSYSPPNLAGGFTTPNKKRQTNLNRKFEVGTSTMCTPPMKNVVLPKLTN